MLILPDLVTQEYLTTEYEHAPRQKNVGINWIYGLKMLKQELQDGKIRPLEVRGLYYLSQKLTAESYAVLRLNPNIAKRC